MADEVNAIQEIASQDVHGVVERAQENWDVDALPLSPVNRSPQQEVMAPSPTLIILDDSSNSSSVIVDAMVIDGVRIPEHEEGANISDEGLIGRVSSDSSDLSVGQVAEIPTSDEEESTSSLNNEAINPSSSEDASGGWRWLAVSDNSEDDDVVVSPKSRKRRTISSSSSDDDEMCSGAKEPSDDK